MTERLTLRPASAADVGDLQALWDHPDVRRFLFDDQPVSAERAGAVLDDCLACAGNGYGLWLIHPFGASGVAGCAGLIPTGVAAALEPRLEGLLEPLVALHPAYWHRGYGAEALGALVRHAFTQLDVSELAAVNDIPNVASGRMLARLGFTVLGQLAGPRYAMHAYLLRRS